MLTHPITFFFKLTTIACMSDCRDFAESKNKFEFDTNLISLKQSFIEGHLHRSSI